jgi:hypothetical protein
MTTLSKLEAHKNFDAKVKNFVGKEIYSVFIDFGVKISHVKQICIRLKYSIKGGLPKDDFKNRFLRICDMLIVRLCYVVKRSNKIISKLISGICKETNHGLIMV